jgi:hypothetical protein
MKRYIAILLAWSLTFSPLHAERYLAQSTAASVRVVMISSTDHITGVEGLTLTVKAAKAGTSALTDITAGVTVTDIDDGIYDVALSTSHTDTLGPLSLRVTATGADESDVQCLVEPPLTVANGAVNADTVFISGDSTAADRLETMLDGTGGNTLSLGALAITGGATIANSGGTALTLNSSGGNGHGINITGNGTGEGINVTAGATGNGVAITSDAVGLFIESATTGAAVQLAANVGSALEIASSNGHAVELDGGGTGHGLFASSGSGATGNGITATAASTNGNGFSLTGSGNGSGIISTAGATGVGFSISAAGGTGMSITSAGGNGHGLAISGNGTGEGFSIAGGTSGNGIEIDAGSSAGNGIDVVSQAGNGLDILSSGGNGYGIQTSGNGSGVGLDIVGGTTGDGLQIDGGTGADDIDLVGDDWPDLITVQAIRANTAQAGAASTITLDASASSVADFYKDRLIYLTGGTGAGQSRKIVDYNGTTKVARVFEPWATTPDNTTTFAILPMGQ